MNVLSVGSKTANVKSKTDVSYNAEICNAAKECIKKGWKVLPFYRGDGICHFSTEEADAFTCGIEDGAR